MWKKAKMPTISLQRILKSTRNLKILKRDKFISFSWMYQLLAAILTLRMNWLGCWYGVGKLFLTATAGHSRSSPPEILEIRNIN